MQKFNLNKSGGCSKKTFLIMILTAIFGLGFFQNAQAAGELTVNKTTRLMYYYRPSNIQASGQNDWSVWNRDNTKILMYEAVSPTRGGAPAGRRYIWMNLSDVYAHTVIDGNEIYQWPDLNTYLTYTHALPSSVQEAKRSDFFSFMWSPIVGEENILYVPLKTGYLAKVDVVAGTVDSTYLYIGDFSTGDENIRCWGWTKAPDANRLLCTDHTDQTGEAIHQWFEIDVLTKIMYEQIDPEDCAVTHNCKIPFTTWDPVTQEFLPWPEDTLICESWPNNSRWGDWFMHGHGGLNPSGSWIYGSGGVALEDGFRPMDSNCATTFIADLGYESGGIYPHHISHVSWKASDDWMLADSSRPANVPAWALQPTLVTYKLWQVFFNGTTSTYNELLSHQTATQWNSTGAQNCSGDDPKYETPDCNTNFGAHFLATLRKDGNQAIFQSTNGKYSYDDWNERPLIATTWDFEGPYLIDLVTANLLISLADVNGDDQVNIKDIQICIKGIIDKNSIPDTQLQKCQAVALPDTVVNIKDIQTIVQTIIGG